MERRNIPALLIIGVTTSGFVGLILSSCGIACCVLICRKEKTNPSLSRNIKMNQRVRQASVKTRIIGPLRDSCLEEAHLYETMSENPYIYNMFTINGPNSARLSALSHSQPIVDPSTLAYIPPWDVETEEREILV
ncbi:unnamed protein product [Didymodactylos carnosus]|uniref:Uncharacterized protein n=1 Tax=Didymodactylos carnosus TaxID=1234261 RepID=A0A815S4F4_9BILA|nr:unnamed protein product [Didymodactylos carnosus]CAF4347846.1 unnamed protein product [Didymodactylos carnosus]